MSVLRQITPVENPIVETERLRKVYGSGDLSVTALNDVDVSFGRGQFTAIMGPSGSGKSTLMHCTAGLDSISSGIVKVNGALISSMSPGQRTTFRRDQVGFIFQAFNLIPSLSALENITLPSDIAGRKIDKNRFDAVISALGIGNRLDHRPAELSGGQQQRVACARALVSDAAVVFADEPTGNLDSESTDSVLGFIRYAVDELGQSVIMVTHEPTAAAWADRVVFLSDGDVHAEMLSPNTDSVLDALRTFSATGHGMDHGAVGALGRGSSAGFKGTPTPSMMPHLAAAESAAPTPVLMDRTPGGEKAFTIPGLGKVVVSGDVHVHVYDHDADHYSTTQADHDEANGHHSELTWEPEGAAGEPNPAGDHLAGDDAEMPTVPPPGAGQAQPAQEHPVQEHAAQQHPGTEHPEGHHADAPAPNPGADGPYVPVEQYGFVRGEDR